MKYKFEITYDEDILDENAFTKLMEATQDSTNFQSYKILFCYNSQFFYDKKKDMNSINMS